MPNLNNKYQQILGDNNWSADEFQQGAVGELQRLLTDLNRPTSIWPWVKKKEVQGVYLYGGVGRGKSMLMDLFFEEAVFVTKRRRVHFHEFMIETHNWLHEHRGNGMDDLLPRYAAYVAKQTSLLCFDEFHITDVADAMIIGRLFTELFNRGVVVVATSNWAPDNLYEGGLQRDRFLPFIALLKEEMTVLHLDSDTDYRSISDPDQDVYYFSPLNTENKNKVSMLFSELTSAGVVQEDTIEVKGRCIAVQAVGDVAWFNFSDICERAYGAEDYIAMAQKYDTVFLVDTPILTAEKRNEAKRLILFIDCLYEAKCRLIISAQTDINHLHEGCDHAFEFDRTVSRLMEMQSSAYHEERVK